MAYEPTQWKAGDTVTSAKLNKMEQGIAASGGIRIVHLTMNDDQAMQLDITPNELMNAFENGEAVIVITHLRLSEFSQLLLFHFAQIGPTFEVIIKDNSPTFVSSDPDEYFTYVPSSDSSNDDDSGDTTPVRLRR